MSTPNTTTSPTIPTSTSTTSGPNPILLVEIVPIEKWTNKILKKDQNIITKYTVKILAQNMTQTEMTNKSNDNYTIFKTPEELEKYIKDKTNIYLIKDGSTKQNIDNDDKKLLVDSTLPAGVTETIQNASSNIGKEIEKQSGNITDWFGSVGKKISDANPSKIGGKRKTRKKSSRNKSRSRS